MLQRCTDPPQDWLPAATALALSVVRAHGAPATAHGPQRWPLAFGPWRSGPRRRGPSRMGPSRSEQRGSRPRCSPCAPASIPSPNPVRGRDMEPQGRSARRGPTVRCRASAPVPVERSARGDGPMGAGIVRQADHSSRRWSRDAERALRSWGGEPGGPSARLPARRRGARRGTGSGRRCLPSCSGSQRYWLDREGGLSRIACSTPRTLSVSEFEPRSHAGGRRCWPDHAGCRRRSSAQDQGSSTGL